MRSGTLRWPQSLLLAAAFWSSVGAGAAPLPVTFGPPEDLGEPLREVAVLDSVYGQEGGRAVGYLTVSGRPALFQVIDLASHRLLRSLPLEGTSAAWAHVIAPDGSVYIGGTTGLLHRYDPRTGTVARLGKPLPSESFIWALTADELGNVYGGTYPGGRVFRYDPRTGATTDLGPAVPGQQYVRSIAYHQGHLYAGVGTEAALVEIDLASGERRFVPPPEGFRFGKFVYGLDVRGDYLFVYNADPATLLVWDLRRREWLPQRFRGYRGLFVSDAFDGQVYFSHDGRLSAFDLASGRSRPTGIRFGGSLRHAGWAWREGEGPPAHASLVTVAYDGSVIWMDVASGSVQSLPAVAAGQPVTVQALEKGPDGHLYLSGYMGTRGVRFDPATGQAAAFPLGQAEGIGVLDGRVYFGVYPGAKILELEVPGSLNPREVLVVGQHQDRPFAWAAGGGRVFIGTVPTYGQLGGAVTVFDPRTRTAKVWRDVVPGQSVIGLAYRDGRLYGSTSVWGGLGVAPAAREAKVFVLDPDTGAKLAEVTPAIPGLAEAPKAIGGLAFGPDGKLWAAAQGTILVLDPATLTVERARTIHPSNWNLDHYWRPVYLRWGPGGLLYTTLGGKLTVVDPASLESRVLAEGTSLMALGDDGHLYYARGTHLYRIKVQVAREATATEG